MANEEQSGSALSFTLRESVWLEDEAAVRALLSLELQPDIAVEEHESDIIISGGLRLTGTYEKEEDYTSDEEAVFPQMIEHSYRNDDDTYSLQHFFPVDITIPLQRIERLEDVYIQIDSFDYELPANNCIQMTADVTISGLRTEDRGTETLQEPPAMTPAEAEVVHKETDEEWVQAETEPEPKPKREETISNDNDSASAEKNKEAIAAVDETEQNEAGHANEEVQPTETFEEGERDKDELADEPSNNLEVIDLEPADDEKKAVQSSERQEDTAEEAEEDTVEADHLEDVDDNSAAVTISSQPLSFHASETLPDRADQWTTEENEQLVAESEVSESPEPNNEEEEDEDEDRSDLTKIFAMQEEEESFTRLCLCIVQENETLERIAERYNISTAQLLRWNKLSSERVTEGDLLYIPQKSPRLTASSVYEE
ncbi:stage VI sporulation protein D [Salsuginibacillus halophilus]|uniref:Stage VI sporulation protein D n=1 Tax=Salsuginibacillus halophilus TaxID=517424 RepID=A0A2P8HCN0_9BACI|nr:LysM peptidoglycan-binding domain-containing protein [Salsuginibacillus halophilus]PSL43993.1 stage VI sporulation protein D [Salsuginibacillus halophilus]